MEKYPSKCELREAQLFFPTSSEMMHQTGVDAHYIGTDEKLSGYKGIYCCMYSDCDYRAQVKGIVYSHIRRVHLGVALGCRFCTRKCWWQAPYWSIHMQSVHPQEQKFKPLVLPKNIKAEPIESEVQITEERFEIPTPKRLLETEKEAETPNTLNKNWIKLMLYGNWPSLMTVICMLFNQLRLTHNPPLQLFITVKSIYC